MGRLEPRPAPAPSTRWRRSRFRHARAAVRSSSCPPGHLGWPRGRSRRGPAQALYDPLPDGVVIADGDGVVTAVNGEARRLLGVRRRGRPPARGGDGAPGPGELRLVRHQQALRRASPAGSASPSSRGSPPTAPRCSSPGGSTGSRRFGPGGERRAGDPLGPRPRPPRPRPLRPGRHRGPRAALAADRRQGLRRHPAEQVGPAQRRAEEADAHHRALRLRAALPADHRAARRGPDRHRPAAALPPARRHRALVERCVESVRAGTTRTIESSYADTGAAGLRRPRQARPGRHQRGRQRDPARRGHGAGDRRGRSPSRSPAC